MTLVTGGLGYLGSVLVPVLAQRGKVRVYDSMMFGNHLAGTPNVEFVTGDIRDRAKLKTAVAGVTDVLHLAGVVTDALVDMNPVLARRINVEATAELSRLAHDADVRRLIYVSSSSVYGSQEIQASIETDTPNPLTEYARTKLEAEAPVLDAGGAVIRMATLMGPAPRMRLDTIVNIFAKQAHFDHRITVHCGEQWRTNIHVRDAAAAYLAMLTREPPLRGIWNLGWRPMMALDIAREVARAYGGVPIVVADVADERSYMMSGEQLKAALPGWWPKRTIWDAALDNRQWFIESALDPTDPLYDNTRRMAGFMREEAKT